MTSFDESQTDSFKVKNELLNYFDKNDCDGPMKQSSEHAALDKDYSNESLLHLPHSYNSKKGESNSTYLSEGINYSHNNSFTSTQYPQEINSNMINRYNSSNNPFPNFNPFVNFQGNHVNPYRIQQCNTNINMSYNYNNNPFIQKSPSLNSRQVIFNNSNFNIPYVNNFQGMRYHNNMTYQTPNQNISNNFNQHKEY